MSSTTETDRFAFRHGSGRFKKALVLENPDPSLDERLESMGIEVQRIPEAPDEDELVELLQKGRHNFIFKRSKVQITERVVQASPELAAVLLCCIGDDSVDKEACARYGVMVMNDPISNGRSVAELVIGELVTLNRRIFESVFQMEDSVWKKDSKARFELQGKKLGILGLGNVGRQVAQLASAMGMEIHFYDSARVPREVGEAMGWTPHKSLEEVFRASDCVTVHLSAHDHHGRSNDGVLGYEHFRAMGDKDHESPKVVLNLARGFLFEPGDLRRAVQEGHVHYAITDVFPEEPGSSQESWTNPYEDEPRILATPHIGAATREAQPRIAKYVARTTQLFNDYGMIRNCVFDPRANIDFEADPAKSMLVVVHVDKPGTKKAVDDAVYNAGANNLRSAHIDFPDYGIAYDLSALDRELTSDQTAKLAQEACDLTGDDTAIRWVRTIPLENGD